MNCAIFLLSLCAFATVFAANSSVNHFMTRLRNLENESANEMMAIVSSFQTFAEALVGTTHVRNVKVNQCLAETRELQRYHQAKILACNKCYRRALGHKRIKIVEACYFGHVYNLESDAIIRRVEIKECIANTLAGLPYTMRPASLPPGL